MQTQVLDDKTKRVWPQHSCHLRCLVVAAFSHSLCCANRRCVCGCCGCRGRLLPSAERRALDLPPLWPGRWPGSRPADNSQTVNHDTPKDTEDFKTPLTYKLTGLAVSGDGDTACSRSWSCPEVWPRVSDWPSHCSESDGRGEGKSPVGASQDRSPLLAYSSSIWVAARRRAWETTTIGGLIT